MRPAISSKVASLSVDELSIETLVPLAVVSIADRADMNPDAALKVRGASGAPARVVAFW
jgi:hypothetical protein